MQKTKPAPWQVPRSQDAPAERRPAEHWLRRPNPLGSGTIPCLAFPILAFLLFASSFAADLQRELWVPTENLETVLKKMPRAVFLTPEQYKTLAADALRADLAGDPDRATPKPPLQAAVLSASYSGTIVPGSDVLAFRVEYEIECFTENEHEWAEIPLILPRKYLGGVEIDSRSALRVAVPTKKGAAPPMLLTHGNGRHRVVAHFYLPVKHSASGDSLSIQSAGIPSTSLQLTLPADAELKSDLPFVRNETGTTARFVLPGKAGHSSEIQWTAQKAAPIPGAAILQTCSYVYNIDSTRIRADLGMVINSSLRDLSNQYEVRLPKNLRVLNIEGTELLRWTRDLDSGLVKVDLIPGLRHAADLRILAEADVPPPGEGNPDIDVKLPVASIPGIHRASGTFTLIGSDDIRVKKILTNSLTAPIPDDAGSSVASLPNYIAAFNFPALNESPTVTLSPVQNRFNARIDTLISLKRETIHLSRTLNFIPLEGTLFASEISLPEGEEILSVEAPGGKGFSWSGGEESSGKLHLSWDEGLSPGNPATVIMTTRRDPEGWYSLGDESTALSFQQVTIQHAEAVSGYVAVGFDPSFRVETVSTEGLEPRDARHTPVKGILAWFRLDDYRLALHASRRPSEVEASILSYALPLANTVEIEGQIDLDILYSGIKKLEILLPEKFAGKMRFDSPLLAEQTLGEDGQTWTLTFHQERSGFTRIPYRMVLPLEADTDIGKRNSDSKEPGEMRFSLALPHLKIPSAKRVRGDWVMEANTDTELSFKTAGLDAVDSLRVPLLENYEPRHRVIAAFQYRGDAWDLKLSGTRHPHTDLVSTVIDSLRIDTVASTDGTNRHQAKIRLHSSGEQFLELQLPDAAVLWTLQVDGRTVKPVRAGKDGLRVQLPAHENSRQQINVSLIYQTPGKKWLGSGKETLHPIRVAHRIPVMQTEWFLHLPEGFDYQKFKSNLEKEFQTVDRVFLGQAARSALGGLEGLRSFVPGAWKDHAGRPAAAPIATSAKEASPPSNHAAIDQVPASKPSLFGRQGAAEKSKRQIATGGMDSEEPRSDDFDVANERTRSRLLTRISQGWEMPVDQETATAAIRREESKLKSIIIPSIEFSDTPLREALDFIRDKSVELDVTETDPAKKGINIILQASGIGDTPITLRLSNVPLSEALRYVVSLAQLKYKVDPHAVAVVPISTPDSDLYTHAYIVPPNFLSIGAAGGDGGAADPFAAAANEPKSRGTLRRRKTAKEVLEEAGITFGPGASVVYDPKTSRIIVRNTQDQMELVEALNQSLVGGVKGPALSEETGVAKAGTRMGRAGSDVSGMGGGGKDTLKEEPFLQFGYHEHESRDKIPASTVLPAIGSLFKESEEIGNANREALKKITVEGLDFTGKSLEEAAAVLNEKLAQAGDSGAFSAGRIPQVELALDENDKETAKQKISSLKLGKTSLWNALNKLTGACDTHYQMTASGILIARKNVPLEPMESIFIPLPESEFAELGARKVLTQAGIKFPPGSGTAYNPTSGRLAVKNTRENLEAVVKLYAHYLTPQAPSQSFSDRSDLVFNSEHSGDANKLRGFNYRDAGRLPIEFSLPQSGRSFQFRGLYAPDTIRFRYVNWERQIRLAWIWILIGGLAFWLGAWRRMQQPLFIGLSGVVALTFLPLLTSSSLTAFCNALLIGWLIAMAIWVLYGLFGKEQVKESV